MNQDRNETAQEFMEEIVDDLGYAPKAGKNKGSGSSVDQTPVSKYLIPGGIGIVLVIAVAAFFLMGRNGDHADELASVLAGLNRLEERLDRLEGQKGLRGLDDRIIHLEKEAKRLQQEMQKITSREVTPVPKKAVPEVKQRYHTVRSGESLYSIAKKYGISTERLCQLNKITPKNPIQPGQKLLVGG